MSKEDSRQQKSQVTGLLSIVSSKKDEFSVHKLSNEDSKEEMSAQSEHQTENTVSQKQ